MSERRRPGSNRPEEACREALARGLGLGPGAALDALVCHVGGREAGTPLARLVGGLLDGGGSLPAILLALARCEVIQLSAAAGALDGRPRSEQVSALEALHRRHGELRARTIAAAAAADRAGASPRPQAARPRAETPRRTAAEGPEAEPVQDDYQALLITRAAERWRAEGRAQFFNYYCELQVRGGARVEEVDEPYVTVQLDSKLERVFAAGLRMRYAYTPVQDPTLALRVEIHGRRGGLLTLRMAGVVAHPQGGRHRLRVRVDGEVPVDLYAEGELRGRGRIIDLSETGMGIHLDAPAGLSVGAPVTCNCMLRSFRLTVDLEATGVVQWIDADPGGERLGVELRLEPPERSKLQTVLRAYEQVTIQRLMALGTPHLLR